MAQGPGDLRRNLIGQMAKLTTDTPLKKNRISRSSQQVAVMIGLEDQGAALLQVAQHMGRGMAEVGQNAQLGRAVRAGQLQRFARVVRNRKGRDLQIAEVDGLPVACGVEQAAEVGRTDAFVRAAAHPDGHSVAPRELVRASNVIAVLVRDEDGVDVAIGEARFGQPDRELFEPQAAIDQQPKRGAAPGFNQCGIAGAAAAQAFEA